MDTNLTNIEFYKEFYETEHRRRNEIDNSVGFPTTLLTLLIGGALYLFENIDFDSILEENICLFVAILILTIGFATTMIFTITLLMKMFINVFKKYNYLPSPIELKNRESELIKHYQEFYESEGEIESKEKTILEAKKQFNRDLLLYYIDYGTKNQELNDKRIKEFYKSRKYLILSIIIIAIIGILLIIK